MDYALGFRGSIAGFNKGDGIALLGFDLHASLHYQAAAGGGGTLTVADGLEHFSVRLDGTIRPPASV